MSGVLRSRATLLGLVVGVPLSAVFLWLAFRGADLGEVRSVLGDSDLGLVALAVAAIGGVYLGQAVRWRAIARTPSVSTGRFAEMVVSGVAVNNVLTYVHSVASSGARFQVGQTNGQVHHPIWTPDGHQLVYFPGGGNAVAVDFRTTPSVGFGRPTRLTGGGLPINVSPGSLLNHDVHPDGRFVTVADVEGPGSAANRNAVVIVQNWFEELKRLVPR